MRGLFECEPQQLKSKLQPTGSSLKHVAMKYQQLAANVLLALSSFLLAYLLLQYATVADYGSFTFLLVLQALGMAVINALVASPLLILMNSGRDPAKPVQTAVKGFLLVALTVATVISLLQAWYFWLSSTDLLLSMMMAVAGWMQLLRWYGRCEWQNRRVSVLLRSDVLFSLSMFAGTGIIWYFDALNLSGVAVVLLLASCIALQPFAAGIYSLLQTTTDWQITCSGLRQQGRPALVGVVTVEATANFHSYLVVLLSGSAAFAPIAAAMLFFRPLSVVLGSLQQSERPLLVRALASNNVAQAGQLLRFMRGTAVGAFTLNLIAVLLVYNFAPEWLWPEASSRIAFRDAMTIWSLIALLRALRSPVSSLLQALDQFTPLARATYVSAICTVPMVLLGWWLAGPVASLLGVLAGELLLALLMTRLHAKLQPVRNDA